MHFPLLSSFPSTLEEPELQETFKYLKASYEWQVKARWDKRIRHDMVRRDKKHFIGPLLRAPL